MPLNGWILVCASVMLVGVTGMSSAQAPTAPMATTTPTEPTTADELSQRGLQLRADIDAVYVKLRASKSLKNTVRDGNDVTAIVLKYIPIGMRFDYAEAILRAAGCKIGPPQQGQVVARTRMKDRLLDLKHALSVELTPPTPGDFSVVHNVAATIYLQYVPNASNR